MGGRIRLDSLEEMKLEAEEFYGFGLMALFVQHVRQIRNLTLNFPLVDNDVERHHRPKVFEYIRAALADYPNLEKLSLGGTLPTELRVLSQRSLGSLPRLEEVHITQDPSEGVSQQLCAESISRLFEIASLKKLLIQGYIITESALQTISHGLANAQLSELAVCACSFPHQGGGSLVESLKTNTALTTLSITDCKPDVTFFTSLQDALSSNQSLVHLKVILPSEDWSVLEKHAMVTAVMASCSLLEVNVDVGDEYIQSVLRCIPLLNKAGRSYLREDASSVEKGVMVLEQVKDDLDCLFLHLRENPMLCILSRPMTGRKRKRSQLENVVGASVE